MNIERKTCTFLSAISSLYQHTLPLLSQQINLEWELLQVPSSSGNNRCRTHCPECYTSLETGENCSVRRRTAKELKLSSFKLRSVDRNEKVVLGKRNTSYWTIPCRICGILFIDLSAKKRMRKRKYHLLGKNRKYLGLSKKAKRTQSKKNRAKMARIERTKRKLITKRSLQNSQMKGKTLEDFLIECNLKVD